MTNSVKMPVQPLYAEGVTPQVPRFKEGDIVHLKKKIEFGGQIFKKSSVGNIADVQISAVGGDVTYTMNMRDKTTWILVDPQDIISHRPKPKPMETVSNRPTKIPKSVKQFQKNLDKA